MNCIDCFVSTSGLLDKKSRLKLLKRLCLSGTDISDVSLRYITQFLAQLAHLQIASCWKVTDAGLAQFALPEVKCADTLSSIDLTGCKGVSNAGLSHLAKCKNLTRVSCARSGANNEGMKKFIEESKCDVKLKVHAGGLIDRRQSKR